LIFILYRSRCKVGFNDREMAILDILQSHLANLAANLQNQPLELPVTDLTLKVREFRQLTQREVEITTLLCQGINTKGLSSKLFISRATVYRHINNIFEKLQVSNRQELITTILGTDNQDDAEPKLHLIK
jgi:DNA-binding NarL/FixJ family response regulator